MDYPVRRLCQTLKVHPSGYYAWLAEPKSIRAKEDQRLLGLIKHAWLESGGVYGYRKIHDDLRELGETCGRHRVARLMRVEGLRSQTGYRRRPGYYGGKPTVAAPNRLERQFNVSEPNKVWVTDITYIRTYEGWLYLAVVLDLFSPLNLIALQNAMQRAKPQSLTAMTNLMRDLVHSTSNQFRFCVCGKASSLQALQHVD